MPLRLRAGGRILVLHQQLAGTGLTVAIETGRVPHAVCSALIDRPARPELGPVTLYVRGAWFEIRHAERPLIEAWLSGYYGDAEGGAS